MEFFLENMHTASSRLKREEADRLLTHRRRKKKSLLSSQSTSLMALVPMRWEASKNLKDIQVLKQHIIVVKSVHVDWSFYSTFVLYVSTQNFFICLSGFFFFFKSNIHTLVDASKSKFASCLRIFGTQIGPARDQTNNLPSR